MALKHFITIPTARGWLFGAYMWGPSGNPMFWRVESGFDILDEPDGKSIERVVLVLLSFA